MKKTYRVLIYSRLTKCFLKSKCTLVGNRNYNIFDITEKRSLLNKFELLRWSERPHPQTTRLVSTVSYTLARGGPDVGVCTCNTPSRFSRSDDGARAHARGKNRKRPARPAVPVTQWPRPWRRTRSLYPDLRRRGRTLRNSNCGGGSRRLRPRRRTAAAVTAGAPVLLPLRRRPPLPRRRRRRHRLLVPLLLPPPPTPVLRRLLSGRGTCTFSATGGDPPAVAAAGGAGGGAAATAAAAVVVSCAASRRRPAARQRRRRRRRVVETAAAHFATGAVAAAFSRLPPVGRRRRHLQATAPVVGAQVVQRYADGACGQKSKGKKKQSHTYCY